MESLKELITPYVYSNDEMVSFGWKRGKIQKYTYQRNKKWRIGLSIMKKMFKELGEVCIDKVYIPEQDIMRVTIERWIDGKFEILSSAFHSDPLFALAECAKELNKEDEFLSAIIRKLKL